MKQKARDINSYVSDFPEDVQKKLRELYALITKIAPDAVESISYGMPAFKLHNAPLAYFAAYKNHIGLYPAPSVDENFTEDLSAYKTGKGSIQFPLSRPLPKLLIKKIIMYRKQRIKSAQ